MGRCYNPWLVCQSVRASTTRLWTSSSDCDVQRRRSTSSRSSTSTRSSRGKLPPSPSSTRIGRSRCSSGVPIRFLPPTWWSSCGTRGAPSTPTSTLSSTRTLALAQTSMSCRSSCTQTSTSRSSSPSCLRATTIAWRTPSSSVRTESSTRRWSSCSVGWATLNRLCGCCSSRCRTFPRRSNFAKRRTTRSSGSLSSAFASRVPTWSGRSCKTSGLTWTP
mmetsp:Transcript_31199/g.100099  ORF Transcript_31199/g.100099 Transcript_31199/m.100099 type:complete len:219 (-) Transcript_31199:533-1189(-)